MNHNVSREKEAMEDKRHIHELRLRNLLSFGDEGVTIDLLPLNVLIGPNASGKSNFIEALRLLRAAPRDLAQHFRDGGGIEHWLWKGASANPIAEIEATVAFTSHRALLRYRLRFTRADYRVQLIEESIMRGARKVGFPANGNLDPHQSALAQLRGPNYPEITHLSDIFSRIAIYQPWDLSAEGAVRRPQRADLKADCLSENADNLGIILNNYSLQTKQEMVGHLREVYEEVEEIQTTLQGGLVQIAIRERGLKQATPAIRLADGLLRYLCWLTLLAGPQLPPLICIEEPEIGLHPDLIHKLADLLIAASERTQLVITTQSTGFIHNFTDLPAAVVVCERGQSGTSLTRLEPKRVGKWLKKYSLDDLWMMGEIGGTRW